MTRTVLFSAIAVISVVSTNSNVASAASIKEIGDGMVQVKAYGETLVFRKADSERVLFDGLASPCADMANGSSASLAVIFNNPTMRDCIEKTAPDEPDKYGGVLEVRPKRQGDDVYPGPVKASAFPKFAFDYNAIRIVIASKSGTYTCEGLLSQGPPDGLGFVSEPIGYAYQKMKKYQLPASLRAGKASRPLCIICSPLLGDDKSQGCFIRLETMDGQTSMTLSWMILGFHGPDPSWMTYDETARQIANSIFAIHLEGDLQ